MGEIRTYTYRIRTAVREFKDRFDKADRAFLCFSLLFISAVFALAEGAMHTIAYPDHYKDMCQSVYHDMHKSEYQDMHKDMFAAGTSKKVAIYVIGIPLPSDGDEEGEGTEPRRSKPAAAEAGRVIRGTPVKRLPGYMVADGVTYIRVDGSDSDESAGYGYEIDRKSVV